MPYTRITLIEGASKEYLAAVSRSLHRALVETFEVPPADLFQIYHQVRRHELVVDSEYLGGPRSDQFIHFSITTGKPRNPDQKRALYRRLVELLEQEPGIPKEDVMVVISNSQPEDWSFGGGRVWNEPKESK
jgi:phenylpyruvate tautomerase PptA (4-oxalocrotonate tautomerase family)